MIRRSVLMAVAMVFASLFFASAAQAGSYTPPSSDPGAVESDQVSSSSAQSGSLPATGSDTTEDLLRVGIILVAAGGMIAFVARRVAVARR